jgi:hypothetical protein
MKKIEIIGIEITVFIVFVIIFTFLYKNEDRDLHFDDALYIAVGFQTFNGTNIGDSNKKLRNLITLQMVLSYTFVMIVMYTLIKS